MRLINASTIQLADFEGRTIPRYAILSHRWGIEEVSFADMREGKGPERVGYQKIRACCAQALRDGWEYVWVDSCCIDKSSSAELSEAINSMFQWYRDAQMCYAYLVDVPSRDENHHAEYSAFQRSKWFTRGWTLQELLAPSIVIFYDCDWQEIGTKTSLEGLISFITGIESLPDFDRASVAQKMSWASKRETTRVEDMAYCLLGLFGLNMTPIYGEGEKSFIRLQLEILSKSDDETLFAWTSNDKENEGGLLAQSPAAFQHSGDIERVAFNYNRPPYAMTNKGLRIELVLHSVPKPTTVGSAYFALLNCARKGKHHPLAIYLKRKQWEQFERRNTEKLDSFDIPASGKAEVVYVRQPDQLAPGFYEPAKLSTSCIVVIKAHELPKTGFSVAKRYLSNPTYGHWIDEGLESHLVSQLVLKPPNDHKYMYGGILFTDKPLADQDIISSDEDPDLFVVLIKRDHTYSRAWVNVFIPEAGFLLEENIRSFNANQLFPSRSVDRFSLPLRSGRSVSLALRKVGMSKAEGVHYLQLLDSPGPRDVEILDMDCYVLEVTIDDTGRLEWGDAGLRRPK